MVIYNLSNRPYLAISNWTALLSHPSFQCLGEGILKVTTLGGYKTGHSIGKKNNSLIILKSWQGS